MNFHSIHHTGRQTYTTVWNVPYENIKITCHFWNQIQEALKPRKINAFWEDSYNAIKDTELNWEDKDGQNTPHITEFMQPINLAYAYAKDHFHYRDLRDTNERYFEHLRRSWYNIINKTDNPTRLKIIVALLHDVIENTNDVTFFWLLELFHDKKLAKQVALAVMILSKDSLLKYIKKANNTTDLNTFLKIQDYSDQAVKIKGEWYAILNKKWLLTREFKERKKRGELSKQEERYYIQYQSLKKKYKQVSDDDYYSRFTSTTAMRKYATQLASKHDLHLKNQEIDELVEAALDAKDADRLDNLETEFESSNNKIRRKLREYKKYFLPRIKKEKPKFLSYIEEVVKKLEEELERRKVQNENT